MDQERKEEIIKLYGEPFMQTKSGGVKLNKLCLSELFNASVVIRYIIGAKYEPYECYLRRVSADNQSMA